MRALYPPAYMPDRMIVGFIDDWCNGRYGLLAEANRHCSGKPKGHWGTGHQRRSNPLGLDGVYSKLVIWAVEGNQTQPIRNQNKKTA